MKKKISVLGLILAAAFVLFTSCDPMAMAEGMLKNYEIKADNNPTNATLSVSYNKFLNLGGYALKIYSPHYSESGLIKIKGLFEKELVLSERKEENGSSLPELKLKINNKKVVIKGYTFDLSPIM